LYGWSAKLMARVLVIDDDALVRKSATILLSAHGFDVVAVADGQAGVDAVKIAPYDVVIVDLFMPGLDGLQTTAAILKHRPAMPVIAASGFMFGGGDRPDMPNFDDMAREAGAVATLYKPFRPAELLGTIRKAIGVTARA
jgi:CheY-like chemotaxis protein